MQESIHVTFDDTLGPEKSKLAEKFVDLKITFTGYENKKSEVKDSEGAPSEATNILTPLKKFKQRVAHYETLIIGDKTEPDRTRSSFKPSKETLLGLVSIIEPISVDDALLENEWILAMQEEMN